MADPADLLPIDRRANLVYRVARLIGIPILRLAFRIDVTGRQRIPRRGPYVLIANHLNWLDSFVILVTFPAQPRIHFLADPEGLMKRRLQWLVVRKVGGYVAVDRHRQHDEAMFERARRSLALGAVLAIYPEGDYGPSEGRLLAFKKGFAHFALQTGSPVLPVALSGTRELWLRKRIRVAVGELIPVAGETPETLVARAQTRLEALLPAYVEPPGPKPLRRWLTTLF